MSASKHDWGLVFAGIALAVAGLFCLAAPGLTIVTIAAVVGAFFLVAGVFDIIGYVRFRNIMPRSGWELAYSISLITSWSPCLSVQRVLPQNGHMGTSSLAFSMTS